MSWRKVIPGRHGKVPGCCTIPVIATVYCSVAASSESTCTTSPSSSANRGSTAPGIGTSIVTRAVV